MLPLVLGYAVDRVLLICEPASHVSYNASHAIHASQGASHASHYFNMKKKIKEYNLTAANAVQITVEIFSDIVQFFEQ